MVLTIYDIIKAHGGSIVVNSFNGTPGGSLNVNSFYKAPGTITVNSYEGPPGGEIRVESTISSGSEFIIHLPIS